MQITVVDYGMGNAASIANMLTRLGYNALVTADAADVIKADKLIIPGVGSFDSGMRRLQESGLVDVLNKKVLEDKTPVLGICLGMQLMTQRSEEGTSPGLGWLDANVVKFDTTKTHEQIRIPHVGWNTTKPSTTNPLISDSESRFYFVHAFHMSDVKKEEIAAVTHYGYDFVSAVVSRNVFGVQFHPEKSHRFGMALLKNFVEKT